MKIRHAELEGVRGDPKGWVGEKKSPSGGTPRLGYDGVLRNAIGKFHATLSRPEALAYLEKAIKRNDFKNLGRIEEITNSLGQYIDWAEGDEVIVVDRRVILDRVYTSFISLGGIVWRVDAIPEGMRGVLLGDFGPNWRSELRFPLMQKALAERYARPVDEIFIGCQQLDGSELEVLRFEPGSLAEAEQEFTALCVTVEELWTAGD